MRDILIISLLSFTLAGNAQELTDSAKVHNIDEVVVNATRSYATPDGVVYIPSKEAIRHAFNISDLLARMMVAGLLVDLSSDKVSTTYGADVHFYIDGVEAQDWEVKALRPKDVLHVDYLKSPSDPKYKNYEAVVNLVMKKYKYGGYVLGEAGQTFVKPVSGDYNVAVKVNTGKWTLSGMSMASYSNINDIISNTNTRYTFSPDNIINRSTKEKKRQHNRGTVSAAKAIYNSDKFLFITSAGFSYDRTPVSNSDMSVTYNGNNVPEDGTASTRSSSKSAAPYADAYFEFPKLPHNSLLYGKASFSYNHNDASSLYTFDKPIFNATEEDVYLPNIWAAYAFPIYKRNYLTLSVQYYSEIYKTRYTGTDNTRQKLINNNLITVLRYNHRFNDNWSASTFLKVPVNSYKVNDGKYNTTPYVNGDLTLNGRVGTKHSIYANAEIYQMAITPTFYNTVIRQDNEIEGTKGNASLKPQRYVSTLASYSWMPSNSFSLSASLSWEEIMHDIVPSWHPDGNMMVQDIVNSGNYDIISVRLTPSLSLLNSKLNMRSQIVLSREMHTGIRHFSFYNYGIYPYLSYNINKHFSATAMGAIGSKGFMRGGNGQLSRFCNSMRINLQYTTGNLHAMLSVESVLRKKGWYKSWFDSDNVQWSQYVSSPRRGRYFSLSVRYTLDFGRKTERGNEASFDGSTKTSVLGNR